MTGYSARDVAAVVAVSREKQREVDKNWTSIVPEGEVPAIEAGSDDEVDLA